MKTYKIFKGTEVHPFQWVPKNAKDEPGDIWLGWNLCHPMPGGTHTITDWYFTEDELLPTSYKAYSFYVKLPNPVGIYNAFAFYKESAEEVK